MSSEANKVFLAKRNAIIEEGGKQLNVVFDKKHTRWLNQLRKSHPRGTYKAVLETLIAQEVTRLRDVGRSK